MDYGGCKSRKEISKPFNYGYRLEQGFWTRRILRDLIHRWILMRMPPRHLNLQPPLPFPS